MKFTPVTISATQDQRCGSRPLGLFVGGFRQYAQGISGIPEFALIDVLASC